MARHPAPRVCGRLGWCRCARIRTFRNLSPAVALLCGFGFAARWGCREPAKITHSVVGGLVLRFCLLSGRSLLGRLRLSGRCAGARLAIAICGRIATGRPRNFLRGGIGSAGCVFLAAWCAANICVRCGVCGYRVAAGPYPDGFPLESSGLWMDGVAFGVAEHFAFRGLWPVATDAAVWRITCGFLAWASATRTHAAGTHVAVLCGAMGEWRVAPCNCHGRERSRSSIANRSARHAAARKI